LGSSSRICGLGSRIRGLGFRVLGAGLGFRLRVQWSRVWGLGSRVWGLGLNDPKVHTIRHPIHMYTAVSAEFHFLGSRIGV
jgi:hypothetical protein